MQGSKENADVENSLVGPGARMGGRTGSSIKETHRPVQYSQRGRCRVLRGSARAPLRARGGMGGGGCGGGSRGRDVCIPTGDSC